MIIELIIFFSKHLRHNFHAGSVSTLKGKSQEISFFFNKSEESLSQSTIKFTKTIKKIKKY